MKKFIPTLFVILELLLIIACEENEPNNNQSDQKDNPEKVRSIENTAPTWICVGDTVFIKGSNLNDVSEVNIGGIPVNSWVDGSDHIFFTISSDHLSGNGYNAITLVYNDTTLSSEPIKINNHIPEIETQGSLTVSLNDTVIISGKNLDVINSLKIGNTTLPISEQDFNTIKIEISDSLPSGIITYCYSCGCFPSNFSITISEKEVFELQKILPNNNPNNGPLMIVGIGMNLVENVQISSVNADFEIINDSAIITRVPKEASVGLSELQIFNQEDFKSASFEILSEYPSIEPKSPNDIILAGKTGNNYIPPIARFWDNENDPGHRLNLSSVNDGTETGTIDDDCFEEWGNQENKIKGSWKNGEITLIIERSTGKVIYTGNFDGNFEKRMVLFSQSTGRQMVFSNND